MSQDPLFCYLQVLDSINEMRQTIAAEVGGETDFNQPAELWESSSDAWFEDCEFDPRATVED